METNEDNFSSLKVGDIVWARRYANEEEKNKIESGHLVSPFIIIKKLRKNYMVHFVLQKHIKTVK